MTNSFGGSEPRYYERVRKIEETMDARRVNDLLESDEAWEILSRSDKTVVTVKDNPDGTSITRTETGPIYILGWRRPEKQVTPGGSYGPPKKEQQEEKAAEQTPAQPEKKTRVIYAGGGETEHVFSVRAFGTACKFCDEPISMDLNAEQQWRPYNEDGTPHRCQT